MQAPLHRKIELQSPADLTYLYANTLAFSRDQLRSQFGPSHASQGHGQSQSQNGVAGGGSSEAPDPLERRVQELVEDFVLRTFVSATSSISINGLDVIVANDDDDDDHGDKDSSTTAPGTTAYSFHTRSAVEYEPYDAKLAARVTALYARLESLTTEVARLRREAPGAAARAYAGELRRVMQRDDERWRKRRTRRQRGVGGQSQQRLPC
ncbi:hypothetical protein KEM52_004732 [Ascosphaera acerosa]|nr:hypothetical protein KEM52_004732 [Ascosphaera acerosa]